MQLQFFLLKLHFFLLQNCVINYKFLILTLILILLLNLKKVHMDLRNQTMCNCVTKLARKKQIDGQYFFKANLGKTVLPPKFLWLVRLCSHCNKLNKSQ